MNLKKLYLIVVTIICLTNINAQTKYAKIVVYRNENNNTKVEEEYKIYADDNLTTNLRNYSTEEFYMPEGSFKLRINDENSTTQLVECFKGNSYYFRIYRSLILPDKPIVIVPVDSVTAKNEMKYVKKSVARQTIVSNHYNLNGLGVTLEPGLGFNKVDILSTTAGTEAMISFGGGGTVGLSYSHDFSDNFGWMVELQDQFTMLTPSVTNASVEFNNGIISTTPYFSIPITFKNEQKIKIGAGLDYHFSPVLTLETDKLKNGYNDEWIYNNAVGYHLVVFFEMKLGKYLRGHTGLKYSDVSYSFSSSQKYQPTDADLKSPHGNSLSGSLGLDYCF